MEAQIKKVLANIQAISILSSQGCHQPNSMGIIPMTATESEFAACVLMKKHRHPTPCYITGKSKGDWWSLHMQTVHPTDVAPDETLGRCVLLILIN